MYTSFIDFPSLSRLDSEMSCFICGLVSYETHSIIDTRTLYRDITLDNVVYDFISKYFDIEIEDEDIVCDTCVALLEALDRLRCELEDVERMLLLQVNRKYKLGEARVCPMDDRTAQRYQKGTYERFACVECSFETDFADCLMPHSWRHDYQPDFKKRSPIETDHSIDADVCSVCDLVFSCGELLEWHFQEFHGDLVTTDVVNEDASSPDQQEIDEQGVNDDNVNNEEITDKNETKGEVITDLLLCDKCKYGTVVFESQDELQQHFRTVHFICEICNSKCRNEKTLQGHIWRQHTKHVCDKCGKEFGTLSSHQAHQTVHGINLKFRCPHCDKGFRAKSQLYHHEVCHTKECNFTCHICGQKFVHQRTLRLHVQLHTNPRPHKCPQCEKTFKHISHLAVHRRSHSGELPKACEFCEKRFVSSSKLKVHLVQHTGVYSHPCQQCSRGFMKRYKLAEHMLNVHGDKTMLANKPKCEYKMVVRPEPLLPQSDDDPPEECFENKIKMEKKSEKNEIQIDDNCHL